jgi:Fur family peroxide stress response transcriptional regulator
VKDVTSNIRRSTKQRTLVLEIVEHAKSHPTAEEVLRLARKKMPNVSLATVYRNLHLLAEEGKIREVQFQGDVTRYDGMLDAHEHFYCTSCGAVQDLTAKLPATTLTALSSRLGVTIDRYALDYYGLCSKCSRKSSSRG